jgi:hypothetical protein
MFAPKIAKAQTNASESPTRRLAPQPSTLMARPFGGGAIEQAHMPQRSIGNQATLRFLSQRGFGPTGKDAGGDHEQETDEASLTAQVPENRPSWDFSKIPLFPADGESRPQPSSLPPARPLAGSIKAKLAVARADDPLEYEADRVADQVMRMPDPKFAIFPALLIERKYAAYRQGSAHHEEMIQRKPSAAVRLPDRQAPPIVHDVLRSSGNPLDPATRAFFEPRFGRDLSEVRIHSDANAVESALAVGARAYAVGAHIVTNPSPTRRLVAHELAHVVLEPVGAPVLRRQSDGSDAPQTLSAALERIRQIPIVLTTEAKARAVLDALRNIDLSIPANLDAVTATVAQIFAGEAGSILTSVLTVADAKAPRRALPEQRQPTPEEKARMDAQIRALQVPRRGPYGQVGPGVLLPEVSQAARPLLPLANALQNSFRGAGAFVEGIMEGLSASLSREQVQRLSTKLAESTLLNVAFPALFATGAVVGIAQDVVGAVKGVYHLITNLREVVNSFVELIQALLSEQSRDVAHAIGVEIGRDFAGKIGALLEGNIFAFTYNLGRLIGPTIVYTVLAFLGVPEMLAEQLVARLMPILEQFFERFPAVLRAVEALAGPLRRVGRVASASELDAELERSFAATFTEKAPTFPRSGPATTQAPEIAAGFSAQQLPAFRRLLGKALTSGDVADMARLWQAAANPGEAATLTLENSRRLFDNQRNRFWRLVRADSAAKKLFEDAGCVFEGEPETAPFHRMPDGSKFQMTIDHIVERQSDPTRALDPSNLRIVSRRENVVLLRQITEQDPFQ